MEPSTLPPTADPWVYVALAGLGVVTGTLNVLAGGGSFLTLPLLIFLGLPAGVANGTNRVGILTQNVSAVWSFRRQEVLDRRALFWAAGPATLGSLLGTFVALRVDDGDFQRILAFLMVLVTLASFVKPKPTADGPPEESASAEGNTVRVAALAVGFFGVGIYGGFVQAGVGFLILAATTFAGLDLVRGNAVKVLSVLCFTVLSLGIFAWNGKVHWPYGLALAVGTLLGGYLGARLTVLKGHRFIKRLVTVAVLVFAVRLWLG